MSGVVLVTGGTGKTGKSLVAQLQKNGLGYRAAARSGEPPFDWAQRATWSAALEDVASVYLVAPSTLEDPYSPMIEFLKVAMLEGARRFVLLSMSSLSAGGPAQGQVHQWLKENGEDWAVLRPTAFMQNFSEGPYLATIRSEDTFYSNTGTGRVPFINTVDIASAALAALTAPAALNRDFILTADELISYDRVAELISQACGRRISHTRVSTEALTERFRVSGLPGRSAKLLAAAYQSIAEGAEERTTDAFKTLTGKSPITFWEFAEANADVWRPAG
jgi:uncharacterized protein YbjT (DUF2867 family)